MYMYCMQCMYTTVDQCEGCKDRMPAKGLDNTEQTQWDQEREPPIQGFL